MEHPYTLGADFSLVIGFVVAGGAEVVRGGTFVDGAVDEEMTVGHGGDGGHFVAHEEDGGALRERAYHAVEA